MDDHDRDVASYRRDDRVLTVLRAGTADRRRSIQALRQDHGAVHFAGFGVDSWDTHDVSATQLVCVESGETIGAIRVGTGTVGSGEVFEDFADLALLPTGCPARFVTFSRHLVASNRRSGGVGTVLAHAACAWWSRNSAIDDLVVTAALPAVGGLDLLGLRHLTAQRYLGPGEMPVIVMSGKVSDVLEQSRQRLSGKNWSTEIAC